MCSVNEEIDDVEQFMEKKPSGKLIGERCKKCNENKADIVLRVKDAYCRDCFLAASTHKFRAALGKSKIVRPQDHILLAFSGSQASVALLHLVYSGLNEANHKRLLFSCSAIYIDEGAVLDLPLMERRDLCNSVAQQFQNCGIPLYITSLEKCFDEVEENTYYAYDTDISYVDKQKEELLKHLLNSVKSLTTKEDLLQKLRNRLLLKVAKQLKCTKIFTAETTSDLAVKLLSNVSLGRGAQLPLDVGFCDTRDPAVMLLRPMRDFAKKEVVFYNVFNKLESIIIPSLITKADSHASIQKLTEKFVTDLQEEFPSTVSTIFRTGDKLSVNKTSEENECCVFCQAPLDTAKESSSALQATEFSRMISALGPNDFDSKTVGTSCSDDTDQSISTLHGRKLVPSDGNEISTCIDSDTDRTSCESGKTCQCKTNNVHITLTEAESCLCYSCRLTAREMISVEALPSEVIHSIRERLRFKEMRKEIQDFLL